MEDLFGPDHREAERLSGALAGTSAACEPPCTGDASEVTRNDSTTTESLSALQLPSSPAQKSATTSTTITTTTPDRSINEREGARPSLSGRERRSRSDVTTPAVQTSGENDDYFDIALLSPKLREHLAEEEAKTPPAARPLFRRSTSDALKNQEFLKQKERSPSQSSSTPGPSARPPLRRQRSSTSSTHSTHINNGRPPQPSFTLSPPSASHRPMAPTSPRICGPRPTRPILPRRVSHEVQQRHEGLMGELHDLRGRLEPQKVRREWEMTAVGFTLNRIVEQQKNQMKVQSMLMERLSALDLEVGLAREAADDALKEVQEEMGFRAEIEVEVDSPLEEEGGMCGDPEKERSVANNEAES